MRVLSGIGVARLDSYRRDGHSEFFGSDDRSVSSEPAHEFLTIADNSDRDAFVEHPARHERGETDSVEMSKGLAASSGEKWTMNTIELSVTYLNIQGDILMVEQLD